MKFRQHLQVRESFIHLKGLKTFINLESIEQLDYDIDANDELVGMSIYFKSKDEPVFVSEIEDIATLAYYFFDFELAEDKRDLKREIDAIGDELVSKAATVLDENIAKIEAVLTSRAERLNAALNSFNK